MKQYIIKFNNTQTYYELFESVAEGLNFPNWCGKSLDSVWDLLTSDIKVPAIIYLEGTESIHKSLSEKFGQIVELFDEAVKWYKDVDCYLEIKIVS